jgi:ribose transport system substrate-binding protein
MKKVLFMFGVLALILGTPTFAQSTKGYKIAWYASAVHPYFDAVKKGVEAFEKDYKISVLKQIGPDWNQESETNGIEALIAKGYRGFAVYPSNASGANSVYKEVVDAGGFVVNFGASSQLPTPASFAVATDVKYAASVATQTLIKLMGNQGNILDVLEVLTDPNTVLRKQGVEEVVKAFAGTKIIQEVADINSIEAATQKIQDAIAAQNGKIDGIVCTGYTTTVAAAQILTEYNKTAKKKIRFIGIDDDPVVIKALKAGYIDATIGQNNFGHGYISCVLDKYLLDGWVPKPGKYHVNSGIVVVTQGNVDSYQSLLGGVTKDIVSKLEKDYLDPPKK